MDKPTQLDLIDLGIKDMPTFEPDKLTDDTIMYFGVHKGKKLKDIPDKYFIHLYAMTTHWLEKNYPKMCKYAKAIFESPDTVDDYGSDWCGYCSRPDHACKCDD